MTIGQFSIIRLERDTQLLIPAYDYCMPDKECPGVASDEDPCMLFSRIRFPVEEFFLPTACASAPTTAPWRQRPASKRDKAKAVC